MDIIYLRTTKLIIPNSYIMSDETRSESDLPVSPKKDDSEDTGGSSESKMAKPTNINSESSGDDKIEPEQEANMEHDELLDLEMQLIERDEEDGENESRHSDEELEKTRASERLRKLRNLVFNVNTEDPKNEFETIPAYIRRNMEVHNDASSVEDFYSNYEVKAEGAGMKDGNNLTLLFDLEEYEKEEISHIIDLLSDLYRFVGGDRLTIKTINTLELFPIENPVLA